MGSSNPPQFKGIMARIDRALDKDQNIRLYNNLSLVLTVLAAASGSIITSLNRQATPLIPNGFWLYFWLIVAAVLLAGGAALLKHWVSEKEKRVKKAEKVMAELQRDEWMAKHQELESELQTVVQDAIEDVQQQTMKYTEYVTGGIRRLRSRVEPQALTKSRDQIIEQFFQAALELMKQQFPDQDLQVTLAEPTADKTQLLVQLVTPDLNTNLSNKPIPISMDTWGAPRAFLTGEVQYTPDVSVVGVTNRPYRCVLNIPLTNLNNEVLAVMNINSKTVDGFGNEGVRNYTIGMLSTVIHALTLTLLMGDG